MYLKVMLEVINDFATNVKKQRKKLAMSQEELANKADVSIQTYPVLKTQDISRHIINLLDSLMHYKSILHNC